MTKRLVIVVACIVAFMALFAAPAFAYQESATSTDPANTPSYSCPTCHSLEANATSPTVAPGVPSTWTLEATATVGSRKGPHGGYTAGTQKCAVCHTMHGSSQSSILNLNDSGIPPGTWTSTDIMRFEETIAATCFTCHDGTGGGGVYGVIRQRTGQDPAETSSTAIAGTAGGVHRIGWLNSNGKVVVPGGNPAGGSLETTFTGRDGALTCTDCHSPHNSRTVAPFVGDRKRSTLDTTSVYATNRLLKQRPTKGGSNWTKYGSEWCQSCHKGSTSALHHPIADAVKISGNPWNYSNVSRLATYSTESGPYVDGPLGGNNFGYIMVLDDGRVGLGDASLMNQPYPICQQCHEDSRNIGGAVMGVDNRTLLPSQAFTNPADGNLPGNPRFQNFPHETMLDGLLVEPRSFDSICLNCHSL